MMMASPVQEASRGMDDSRPSAISARFLRAELMKMGESTPRPLASGDADLAWPRLVEHGTAHSNPSTELVEEPRGVAFGEDAAHPPVDATAADAGVDEAALKSLRSRIVGEMYKSSYHRVFAFARRLVCDEEAEEIAHETFVRLLRVRNLERMSLSVAYLLRIAENLVRRRHGRAQRYRVVLERSGRMVPGIEMPDERPVVAGAREAEWSVGCTHNRASESQRWDADRLDSVLRQLTPAEQSAIRLIVCEGLDYQAAARSLGVPVSTINNWKHRAITKLKHLIECESQRPGGRVSLAAG
jgi:hypothetical protein